MSALDELLKKEYWERDYDDKGEYWWYCGGDDPKIAREELEAMKARIAELEAENKKLNDDLELADKLINTLAPDKDTEWQPIETAPEECGFYAVEAYYSAYLKEWTMGDSIIHPRRWIPKPPEEK